MFAYKFQRRSTRTGSLTLNTIRAATISQTADTNQHNRQPLTLVILLVACLMPLIQQTSTTPTNAIQSSSFALGPVARQHHHQHQQDNNRHSLKSHNLLLAQAPQPPSAAEPPDFEEPIGNHSVALGKDAQLSCKINNLGNYRTAWLRVEDKGILTIHNNIITRNYRVGLLNNDDGKNFILTIKNVQPSDKGGYMCQINSVPMKYAIGHLDVLTPPVFEDFQQTSQLTTSSSSLLMVADGSQADQASITTTNSPQQQQQQTSQITVSEGANATLSCRANGHPMPEITWRREDGKAILLNGVGGDIDVDQSEVKFEGSSLNFKSVHRLNSGAYLCIASNGVQPSASKRLVLDVQYGPVITLTQTEVAAHINQAEASLECLVNLNPAGTYHWIKLGSTTNGGGTTTTTSSQRTQPSAHEDDLWLIEHDELMQSDKYEIVIKQMTSEKVQMILNIRQVERKDFAWYKCVARNTLGIQSNSVRFYESSSFSLNNMFRGGGGGGIGVTLDGSSRPTDNSLQSDDAPLKTITASDTQHTRPQVLANQQPPSRPLTRSSWIQRSSGSTVRQAGGSSAAGPKSSLPITSSLLFSLLFNCLAIIIATNNRHDH